MDPHCLVERRAQFLKGHADVATVVKPFSEGNAMLEATRVVFLQGVQDLELSVDAREIEGERRGIRHKEGEERRGGGEREKGRRVVI